MKTSKFIGTIASAGSLLYCGYFLFNNPYVQSSPDPDVLTSFTILFFLPMIIAIYASLSLKPIWLIVSSIFSMPLALYLTGTPSVFKWLIVGPVLMLAAGIIMLKKSRKR